MALDRTGQTLDSFGQQILHPECLQITQSMVKIWRRKVGNPPHEENLRGRAGAETGPVLSSCESSLKAG
jgi:hypothetical protein